MNKLLQHQVREHFDENAKLPKNFTELLGDISGSYDQYEKEKIITERSAKLGSKEMMALNAGIKKEMEDCKTAYKELKNLFETIDEVLYSLDMVTLKIIQISAACEKVYGYTAAEFLADDALWQNVIHPDDKYITEQHVQSLYQGKQVVNQYRIIHKDQTIRWIENKIIPAIDKTGRLLRLNGVASDITKRKQAEEDLERSFSLLEATLESTADGILVVDTDAKVVRLNNKFIELWRVPPEVLNTSDDNTVIEFVSDQLKNPEEFISKIKKINTRHNEISFDTLQCKDGSIFERYSQPQLLKGKYVGRVWSFRDITKCKQAENELIITSDALQHALRDINKIMDSSLDVIFAIDEQGYFLQVSGASETVWGYKADELIGKRFIDFVYPEDREKSLKTALNVIAGNNMISFENRCIRKNGSIVQVSWSVRWDPKDSIQHGVARDITVKKNAEKEFENERRRFNDLFLQAPFHVGLLKGPNHVFEMANPLYLQLVGKNDILGKTVKEILPEVEEQGFIEILDGVYKTGKIFSANEMLVKVDKNGNEELAEIYLNFIYYPYINNDGTIEGIFFFAIDVTEQVVSRKKIEESEKRFRQIVETAQEGIWMIDENNITTFVNKKMADILEYSPDEMTGKLNYCFMDEEWKINATENIVKRKLGLNENHDFKYITKSGKEVWTNLSTNPVFDDAGTYRGALAMVTEITERKKAEDKVRESELRYRSVIEQATDSICIADPAMKLYDINPSGSRLLGYSKEELLRLSVTDLFLEEDLKANPFRIVNLKSGETIRNERRFKRKDGTLVDVEVNAQVLEDGRFIVIGRDITERKQAEKLIRESEFRYRSLIEQATEAICISDPSMKFFDMNPAGCRMLGYTKEEFSQLSMTDLLPQEELNANPLKMDELKSGKTIRNERRFKKKDGTMLEVEINGKLLEDGRLIVFGRDISERKRAEKLIKESELRYRSLIEQATDAVCIIDLSLKFIDINPYACQMFGYSKEEALQLSLPDILFIDDLEGNYLKFDEIIPGKTVRNERRLKRKNGTAVVMDLSTKMMEDKKIVIFGHDLTKRKKAEETILRSEADLELKNKELELKNKELEQFAYVASHDMQEPLRTTSSFVELLQRQYQGKLDEKADKYLAFIAQSSDRMKILIKDLLDYSRIGRKKEIMRVDCNLMLNEVVADLGKAISEANVKIKADELPVINGYPTEMKQLFQNLIMNAIKFSKKDIPPEINISVQEKGRYWEFAFSDNGIGIEEEHQERIFIIFQRLHTRNEYKGSGIGLAHCKKIVELHGGKIWIESKPGEGTTFYFTILKKSKP